MAAATATPAARISSGTGRAAGDDDNAARAEILDQHEAGHESARDAAERGQRVHATDHVAGPQVELQRQRGQQRRRNSEQQRRYEKQAQRQAENRRQRQRDAGAALVRAAVGPAPADPVADRQTRQHYADDRGPAVKRHPDIRRDQTPGGDFEHEQDRRAQEHHEPVPDEFQFMRIVAQGRLHPLQFRREYTCFEKTPTDFQNCAMAVAHLFLG
jgi:hypothetical protein